MNTIQKFDTIHQYNEFLGQETLHPLVNVINLAQSCRLRHGLHSFGFYTVFLKEIKCGNLRYGCNYYDYQEGTLVFLAPGQVIGVEDDGKVYQPPLGIKKPLPMPPVCTSLSPLGWSFMDGKSILCTLLTKSSPPALAKSAGFQAPS